MAYVVGAYILGFVVSAGVYNWRAGLPLGMTPMSGHKITARYPIKKSVSGNITGGAGFAWWQVRTGKMFVWPAIPVAWLIKGRPEPSRQFNELARQRIEEEIGFIQS
jgi:hypothetical protein